MSLTQILDSIIKKLGCEKPDDRLLTSYLKAFAIKEGVDVDALPDRLITTYLNAILTVRGIPYTSDELLTTKFEALVKSYGASDIENKTICGFLKTLDNLLGFESVSYIESSGTQAIETNYVVDENDVIELKYALTNLSADKDKMLFAASTSGGGGLWCETYGSSNKWYVRFGSSASSNVTYSSTHASGTLKLSKSSFVINNKEVVQPDFSEMALGTLAVFARKNSYGNYTQNSYMKLYSLKITRDNNIIRDYRPMRRTSDGELGLYDAVTQEFYTNVGSGNFTAG